MTLEWQKETKNTLHIHVKNYHFDTIIMHSLFLVTMVLTLSLHTQRSGPQDHHAHVYKQKKFNKR